MATFNTTDPKQAYVYDADVDTWFPLAGVAAESLAGLTDVIITSPSTSQILVYNGANWVNGGETGDISAVTSGTGITVTNGTGPIPTIAIDTATTVDLNTAQTLTNKTLTSPLINLGINTQTGTTFTPALSDNGKIVTLNNAAAISVTIPTDASVDYPIGAQITFAWITGAGQPTISAVTPGTTTILSTGATSTAPKLRVANSTATAVKLAINNWLVLGDIA